MYHPDDSQVTLVDPRVVAPRRSRGNTVLLLDVDDMQNTVLRLRGDHRPRYFVRTAHNTRTTVHRGNQLLATIDRKTFRPDQITFFGGSPMNLGDWLRAPTWSSFPLTFEKCGTRFEWWENFVGQLTLHNPHSSETAAWFSKSKKRVENGSRVLYDAFIAIKPEYDYMRDTIVVSCLLAEHKLRTRGTQSMSSEGGSTVRLMAYSSALQ